MHLLCRSALPFRLYDELEQPRWAERFLHRSKGLLHCRTWLLFPRSLLVPPAELRPAQPVSIRPDKAIYL